MRLEKNELWDKKKFLKGSKIDDERAETIVLVEMDHAELNSSTEV